MQQTQQSKDNLFAHMTWKEKQQFVIGILMYPALSIQVFLRRRTGFRELKPTKLILITTVLIIAANLAPSRLQLSPFAPRGVDTTPAKWPLILFALAFLAWGLIQRRNRWKDLCNGVRWHTRTRGISWLQSLLGGFLQERHIVRYVDPAVTLLAGLFLMLLWRPLGLWVVFSAFALCIVEQYIHERRLDLLLDGIDGQLEAEEQHKAMSEFDQAGQQNGTGKSHTMEETAGIPTGIAPDIEAQIAKRRARRKAEAAQDKEAA